jgi:acyl carrier protein
VLWRGILGEQEVSAKDNFFDSGGDSLSVAAFQIRIAQVLGIQLPITVLFEFPSVSLLAAHLKGAAKAEPALANAQSRAQKAAAARKQAAGRRA